jgi:hypothetical protein
MPDHRAYHYKSVARYLEQCKVVPLLGAGVNRCGRNAGWVPYHDLPDGGELASYLVDDLRYPGLDATDLLRVSQYYSVMAGSAELYDKLHEIFAGDYGPTAIHAFLARVPSILRARGALTEHQLIVTTNYDDALEKAFEAAGEPFDLLIYSAEQDRRGRFTHRPHEGEPRPVERANQDTSVSLAERTVIMKMHGAVDRADSGHDSYVIAEDDYVHYLSRSDISDLVPVLLADKLRNSHFLFLGYSLRDWNLRVMLHRMWGEQKKGDYAHWAVQVAPEQIDVELWGARRVKILDVDLDEYATELSRALMEPVAT